MNVGVLALQGDFAEHLRVLDRLGVQAQEVRTVAELESVDRLILPGGESTVMSKLLHDTHLGAAIITRVREESFPVFGTCAGAILLAKHIRGVHPVRTLRLLDVTIERNAYGTQADSFQAAVMFGAERMSVSFIRAPRIVSCGSSVEVVSRHEEDPVLVRQGSLLAATFHTEVANSVALHRFFLDM